MKSYQCEVEFAAPIEAVYQAITSEPGLKGWWTTTCEVGSGVGAESIFGFGKTHNVMRTERLTTNQEVIWRCLEQHHEAEGLRRKDEWARTKLRFRLESVSPGSTRLHFEHEGLAPGLECYDICERGWDHFLKLSLKGYVETGRGEPYSEGPSE